MRTFYREYFNLEIKYSSKSPDKYEAGGWLYYGELPEAKRFEINSFAELRQYSDLHFWNLHSDETFPRRKPCMRSWSTNYYNKGFEYAIISTEIKPLPSYKGSIKDLAEELSASEFIDWLKDHGIEKVEIGG